MQDSDPPHPALSSLNNTAKDVTVNDPLVLDKVLRIHDLAAKVHASLGFECMTALLGFLRVVGGHLQEISIAI